MWVWVVDVWKVDVEKEVSVVVVSWWKSVDGSMSENAVGWVDD